MFPSAVGRFADGLVPVHAKKKPKIVKQKEQCWGEDEVHVHKKECFEKDRKIDRTKLC